MSVATNERGTHTLRQFRRQPKDRPRALDAILTRAQALIDRHQRQRLHRRDARRALQHGLERQRRLRQAVVELRVARPARLQIFGSYCAGGVVRHWERQRHVPQRAEAEYHIQQRQIVRPAHRRRAAIPQRTSSPSRALRLLGKPQRQDLVRDLVARDGAEEPRRLSEVELAEVRGLGVPGQLRSEVVEVDAGGGATGGKGEGGSEGRDGGGGGGVALAVLPP